MNTILIRTVINELKIKAYWQNLIQNTKKFHAVPQIQHSNSLSCEKIHCCIPTYNSIIVRHYAKGKDKKKEKGKTKVVINEVQMAELLNVDSIKTQMNNSIEQMKDDFIKHLSIRSATGSIESLLVTVDGEEHTLQELAQISRKNPKTTIINMAIFPQAIPEAMKVIQKSGLNLNPQQDGTTIYIPIPKVTKEHRENLSKNAKQFFTKCKDNIREIQSKYTKSMKKKEGVSEDLLRNMEQQLKALADKYIMEGEQILQSKQKELTGE
ncbi:hypothetical protein HHI36_019457 [Cryptolaemus montrouzieri]|uniref:Ribosome-recycling factor, mitochondrial n=1 Tax=Cryptolaemus montrouzieri TaxID=559131 RepID=A0ABD2P2Y8_9CUCU